LSIITALFGSLFLGLLFDALPGSDEHDENAQGDQNDGEAPADQLAWTEEMSPTYVDDLSESIEQGIAVSEEFGNDHIESATGDLADPEDTSNSDPIRPITDYVAADDQILVEYDEASFPNPVVTVETITDGDNTLSGISLNGQEIGSVLNTEEGPALSAGEIGLMPMSTNLTDGDDFHNGTPQDERIIGRQGNDTIFGGGGSDTLAGWGGDDELVSHGSGGRLSGNQGDDYLEARKTSYGQYHLYGGDGEDTFVMHLDNESGWGHQGFHAHGGDQADDFRFIGAEVANAPLLSRIEDFNASEDSIWVDDVELDLNALPEDMRIVSYHQQQWLLIGSDVMIGLEGARANAPDGVPTMMGSTEEMHFHPFPVNLADLATVQFEQR